MKTLNRKNVHVKVNSVPRCLRHVSEDSALCDAQALAVFLREATAAIIARHASVGVPADIEDSLYGLELCFNLLSDKLDIAAGELPFPLSTLLHKEADGVLWDPNKGAAHE